MAYFRKDNVTLQETDEGKIKELEAQGFEEIEKPQPKKADQKQEPKKETKKASSK